jgi:hypothetical protein
VPPDPTSIGRDLRYGLRDNQRGRRFLSHREFVHLASGAHAEAYATEKERGRVGAKHLDWRWWLLGAQAGMPVLLEGPRFACYGATLVF